MKDFSRGVIVTENGSPLIIGFFLILKLVAIGFGGACPDFAAGAAREGRTGRARASKRARVADFFVI